MSTFRTLFWKIFLAIFVTTTCVLLAAYGFIRAEFRQQFEQMRQNERSQQLIEYVVSRYEARTADEFDSRDSRRPPGPRDLRRGLPRVRILDTETNEYVLKGPPDRPNTESRWVGWDYVSESGGSYKIEVDVSRIAQARAPDLNPYQYAIGLAIIALFSWLLTLLITRPIKLLKTHVTELAEGHFDTKMHASLTERRDEIGDLAAEIDRMSKRIAELIDSKQRLFYDVSHELRAPLARLRAANEIARLKLEKAGETPEIFQRFDREIEALSQMITELMDFVKDEKSITPVQQVNIVDIVQRVIDDQAFSADENRLQMENELSNPITDTKPLLLERALKNLIENALKYSPSDKSVLVSLSETDKHYRIKVQDQGPGIPDNQLDNVIQPFTRLHAESIEGTGLGLSIVSRAMADMEGVLKLSNLPVSGLLAELEWLKAPSTR